MGTATVASTGFEREAEKILIAGGYRFARRSGSNHLIFKHAQDKDRDPIRVPSTPKNPSESLVYLRHAVNKGRAVMPRPGRENVKMPDSKAATGLPMSEKLVGLASTYMLDKAKDMKARRERGDKTKRNPDRRYPGELGGWLKRCIQTHGCLDNADINAAAKVLEIEASQLSDARTLAGAASFRTSDMPQHAMKTDFEKRLPAGAKLSGGRLKGKNAVKPKASAPVVKVTFEPPNGNEGRRLEQGGLTPDEHAEAERRMVEGHRRAEEERAAILARREGTVDAVVGETTNGKKSQLDAAMELLREAALADTHALTEEDIRSLEGLQETFRRHSQESLGAVGQITLILKRVNQREGVPA